MYEDITLVCKECGKEFVFTADEQERYAKNGLVHQPRRCKTCRRVRRGKDKLYSAVCAACGKEAKVPFRPREDRMVYCAQCYALMKEEENETGR